MAKWKVKSPTYRDPLRRRGTLESPPETKRREAERERLRRRGHKYGEMPAQPRYPFKWVEVPDPGADGAPNPALGYTGMKDAHGILAAKGIFDISSRTKRAPGFGWRLPTGTYARAQALAFRQLQNWKAEHEEYLRQCRQQEARWWRIIKRYTRGKSHARGIWTMIMRRFHGMDMLMERGVITKIEQLPGRWCALMFPSERCRFKELAEALHHVRVVVLTRHGKLVRLKPLFQSQ